MGMGIVFEWAWTGNPTGWEWERLIPTGSQIILIHLLNRAILWTTDANVDTCCRRYIYSDLREKNYIGAHSFSVVNYCGRILLKFLSIQSRADKLSRQFLEFWNFLPQFVEEKPWMRGNEIGGNGTYNGNGSEVLSWEWVGMTSRECEGLGTVSHSRTVA